MNRNLNPTLLMLRRWQVVPALVAALMFALAMPGASFAQADVTKGGALQGGKPLVAEPAGAVNAAPMARTADSTDQTIVPAPIVAPNMGPVRVWTTDRYGRFRTSFLRGEVIAFWVQLYNPTPYYQRYPLELWVDDQIRCVTTPCPHGSQRLFAGTITLSPGLSNRYLLARSEYTDQVGEWLYWASDPNRTREAMTRFYLR